MNISALYQEFNQKKSGSFSKQEEKSHHFLCRAGKMCENKIDGRSDFLKMRSQ